MLISIADYARHRGCSYQAVRAAIKSGRISLVGDKLDPAVADLQWEANRRRAPNVANTPTNTPQPAPAVKAAPDGDPDVPALESSRRRREFHEANLAEMRERQKAGELVELREVTLAYTTLAAGLRAALERIPDKVVPRLAAAEPADMYAMLEQEIEQALADMARQAAALPDRLTASAKATP